MGRRFTFTVPERGNEEKRVYTHKFSCPLKQKRCKGTTKRNTRCSVKSTIGVEYCWRHLLSEKHLKIKRSTIPGAGLGVFASVPNERDDYVVFPADTVILDNYVGETISKKKEGKRYLKGNDTTGPYTYTSENGETIIDGACKRGTATILNHNSESPNTTWEEIHEPDGSRNFGELKTKALTDIRNNTELFINYGDAYRFNDNNGLKQKYTTSRTTTKSETRRNQNEVRRRNYKRKGVQNQKILDAILEEEEQRRIADHAAADHAAARRRVRRAIQPPRMMTRAEARRAVP